MAFPDTPRTLIERIVSNGDDADWRQFLNDYWGPVCRFAAHRGSVSGADVEDVASETFEALLTNRLLARWIVNQSAKLRTLLCTVTRNVLSNRARVEQGRARLLREHLELGGDIVGMDAPVEQVDAFYAGWVEDLVEQAVETLLNDYLRSGKGDYFRVLYGRLCDEMGMGQIADSLGIKITSAENYFKAARTRLADHLRDQVRQHVERYAGAAAPADFEAEWRDMGEYLTRHGGIEGAVRRAYAGADVIGWRQRKTERIDQTLVRIKAAEKSSSA